MSRDSHDTDAPARTRESSSLESPARLIQSDNGFREVNSGGKGRYQITAVERAVAVLEAFDTKDPLTQSQIAQAVGLSQSTTLRYLATLCSHGLVERDGETGCYRLGLGLFQLGERALGARDARYVARPVMKSLLERFDETVNLAISQEDALILIDALESTRSIRKGATVGGQDVWHASSLGKAILAFLPEDEMLGVLERHAQARCTGNTLTDLKALVQELARIRDLGYAVDDEESEEGLRCVGAPILDRGGRPSYAISLSGPASRFTPRTIAEMGEATRSAAAMISARLGYAPAKR
jgi:IclR family acetate operon transcriptional repressor